ncbi:MAG: hypothetical protein FJ312_09210 [SAR202 cluster bacterium]|nr:hypothetical protein [SAR202 cluster bacterium]
MDRRMFRYRFPVVAPVFAVVLFFLATLAACSDNVDSCATSTQVSITAVRPQPTASAASDKTAGKPVRLFLAAGDFAVGHNRIPFAMLGEAGPLRQPSAVAAFTPSGASSATVCADATFHPWPLAQVGVYSVEVDLDRAGLWTIEATTTLDDGTSVTSIAQFEVREQSLSPSLGAPAPRTVNKTGAGVADLRQISSDPEPDPDLYRTTVAQAIASGLPTVVSFATPAYCQTLTCGPQLSVLSAMKDEYAGRVNFIHIEVFDNPAEMGGDVTKGILSPHLAEWGLVSEPFTFVLDGQGIVRAKFEGFVTQDELSVSVNKVLEG